MVKSGRQEWSGAVRTIKVRSGEVRSTPPADMLRFPEYLAARARKRTVRGGTLIFVANHYEYEYALPSSSISVVVVVVVTTS